MVGEYLVKEKQSLYKALLIGRAVYDCEPGRLLVDSREVAEMTGKDHGNLMRDIRGYASILENSKLNSQDFFIPSNYKVGGNKKPTTTFFSLAKAATW